MARTRWPSDPVKPWPLIQARQIRPAAPVGATKAWDPADRSIRRTDPNGVSRLGGQAGTQAPDPTPPPSQSQGSRAGSTTHTLPADYVRFVAMRAASSGYAQIGLFWRGLPVLWSARRALGLPGLVDRIWCGKAAGPGVQARVSVRAGS